MKTEFDRETYQGECEWDDISVGPAAHNEFIREVPGIDLK